MSESDNERERERKRKREKCVFLNLASVQNM